MFHSKKLVFGLVAVFALAIGLGSAIAEEVAKPEAKPAKTETKAADAAPATKTPSPMQTVMKWVAQQVTGATECSDCCPSTEKGEAAWRAWFAKTDGPLAGLRTALMADGWNADTTVAFAKKMVAAKGCCGSKDGTCDKGCECKSCKDGAAGPAADNAEGGSCCGKCKEGGECDAGCKCKKEGAAGPAADAPKSEEKKECCSGCDK